MTVPDWWIDVERARLDALNFYSRVLDGIERTLGHPKDLSSGARFRLAEQWLALLQQEREASQRLAEVLKFSDSRGKDAHESGLMLPVDNQSIVDLSHSCAQRSRTLRRRIRRSMDALKNDMVPHHTRPPFTRSFRDSSSSHINLHA